MLYRYNEDEEMKGGDHQIMKNGMSIDEIDEREFKRAEITELINLGEGLIHSRSMNVNELASHPTHDFDEQVPSELQTCTDFYHADDKMLNESASEKESMNYSTHVSAINYDSLGKKDQTFKNPKQSKGKKGPKYKYFN